MARGGNFYGGWKRMISGTKKRRAIVVTFGDRQLDGRPIEARIQVRHPAGGERPALLTDLGCCEDLTVRRNLTSAAIHKAGFDWLCYWLIQRVGERVSALAWFDTYSPPGWAERFNRDAFFDTDPRIDFACRFDWPLAWDLESLFGQPASRVSAAAAKRFVTGAIQVGAHSGVTFGLPTERPFEHAIVTLSSAQPNRRWITDATIGEAYAIGVSLHSFIEPRIAQLLPEWEVSTPTEVQRSMLRCVSQGLSNREIAERMSMSVHTVAYHLRQLEKRFDAQNRVQLAYIAGRILDD